MNESTKTQVNMRRFFADLVYERMKKNKDIWVVTGDLGYKMWDQIKSEFPDRFINVGAAEQALVGVGVGLALEKKIPLVYSITTFLIYRSFETIRNYIDFEKIPVKLIGAGRDKDYSHDGISHWSEENKEVMNIFKNINSFWPDTLQDLEKIVDSMLQDSEPYYINLRR